MKRRGEDHRDDVVDDQLWTELRWRSLLTDDEFRFPLETGGSTWRVALLDGTDVGEFKRDARVSLPRVADQA